MKRAQGLALIVGCALVLALELPRVVSELRRDLAGPYAREVHAAERVLPDAAHAPRRTFEVDGAVRKTAALGADARGNALRISEAELFASAWR